uniref:Uncharacterized protein n=1 Tax=viral metagenome TaxID=1070528 RepID=A0A6C0M2Z0_9ZZZZ
MYQIINVSYDILFNYDFYDFNLKIKMIGGRGQRLGATSRAL